MKTYITVLLIMLVSVKGFAQVGIGITSPNSNAALHLDGNKKSVLLPRMSTVDRDNIINPAEGLVIYNTSENSLNLHVGLGWQSLNDVNGDITGSPDPAACQNDITTNADPSAPIVAMMYDYNGDGNADYMWCARELGIDLDNADGDNDLRTGVDQVWLDRNLGAFRTAGSSTDFQGYGDFYQWGRPMDGHHKINWTSSTTSDGVEQSKETSILATTDTPNHVDFILAPNPPHDWRDDNNNNRWDEESGAGDQTGPCPTGYHVPTATELSSLVNYISDNGNDASAAFEALKLPLTGFRDEFNGAINGASFDGFTWSSSVSGIEASMLYFGDLNVSVNNFFRAIGIPVRCIKD